MKIQAPKPSPVITRELERELVYLVSRITDLYQSQVFGELHKSTVDKFQDAQIGNYAAIFTGLVDKFRRGIEKRFNSERIAKMVKMLLTKQANMNGKNFYLSLGAVAGMSPEKLAAEEAMVATTNAYMTETILLVEKLRDDTISNYTNASLKVMSQGASLTNVVKSMVQLSTKQKNAAKFTARNQINNFNSVLSKTRAQNLGITKAIWRTNLDGRERDSHEDRNGKEFDLGKGCYSARDGKHLLPGVDYQCRCSYTFVLPDL